MNNNQSSKNRKRMKFTYSYAIDITNERFESLVRRIFVQIDQFEIEDEGLYAVINEAKGHLPVLISLGQTSLANPNTEVMNEISEQCREEIIALRMMIDGSKRGGTESTRKAAKILSQWIKKDRSDLSTRGKIKQVTIVKRLMSDIGDNEKITEALTTLSLMDRFEKIVELAGQVDVLEQSRVSERNRLQALRDQRRVLCYDALVNMTNAFAVKANAKGEDKDTYYEICLAIKRVIDDERAAFLSKKTKSANSKDTSDETPEVNTEQEPQGDLTDVGEAELDAGEVA